MDNDPKQPDQQNENPRDLQSFKWTSNREVHYSALLKFIVRKLLPENAEFLVYDLEKIVNERLDASDSHDFEKSDSLGDQEQALIKQIIELITRSAAK